jgi:hypothetical protein
MSNENANERRLFMVLSPRSLPYARLGFESLYRNCADSFSLCLITDSKNDVDCLKRELNEFGERQSLTIVNGEDLADLEQEKLGKLEHLRLFRHGHPCWRKITDPILLSNGRDEMVVIDPDVYFPNKFRFELTPSTGILLMWQRPSCLLPDEVVRKAINSKILLAHHTDIGVAQWRLPIDLEWLDWLIGELGSPQLPRNMHVESIVWAALAMRFGGGYLDPKRWLCWHRSQYKRLLRKVGISGATILLKESFSGVKCFHAGGEAKWWLAEAEQLGDLEHGEDVTDFSERRSFDELSPSEYHALQRRRHWLRKIGYYALFDNH